MNNKKILLGIALAVLAMLTTSATADPNVIYFDPDPACAAPDEEITVTMWLNSTDGVTGYNTDIHFDPDVVNITALTSTGEFPLMSDFVHYGDFVRIGGVTLDWDDLPAGHWEMANLTFVANNTGTCVISHIGSYGIFNWTGYSPANGETWTSGTFNCPCGSPPTPFVINGTVSDSNTNLCIEPWVHITNLNTSTGWDATNNSTSNCYRLVLDSHNVSAGNILRMEVSGCSGSTTIEHAVTIEEMDNGGFNEDIVIEATAKPDLIITQIETPVSLRTDVINPISATVENVGASGAGSFDVSLNVSGVAVDTAGIASLAAGENRTVLFLWTPTGTGDAELVLTADVNSAVDESDELNNNLSETVDVLEKLTVTANVRIEGKNNTVWCEDITFSSSVLVASDGSTHYLNEPTALGILDEADKLGGFGYVLENSTYGLYVSEINNESPIVYDGWMYRVNYISPPVGASDYTLTSSDEVLWYFGAWTAPPLKIELDKTSVEIDEEFIATVTEYNATSATFVPVNEAEVYVDGALYDVTGANGTLTITIQTAGNHMVYADKGTWAHYIRSGKMTVSVGTSELMVSIGDHIVTSGSSVTAPITIHGITDYGTTTISVEYESSVAWVTGVGDSTDSTVTDHNINNAAGIVTLSAWNTSGVTGDVIVAYVTFEARGAGGSSTPLNLTVTTLADSSLNHIQAYDEDGSLTIRENIKPIVSNPQSSPYRILNDNGRTRVPGTNISTLSVLVTDNVGIASVTVDLSSIGGDSAQPMTHAGANLWTVDVNATTGINESHCLIVNATDTSGNSNTDICISLTVYRRGDVVRDNAVDIIDAYYIARYTVGLEPEPDEFIADVMPADTWDGVDIVDAFYIARYTVGLEVAP